MTPTLQRALALLVLVGLMLATRGAGIAPDATWAVFFIAGFHLLRWTRWAFPLLMALAFAVDYVVISRGGMDFWSHYCTSPAYWCLIPAYFSMWAAGAWLQRRVTGNDLRTLGLLVGTTVVAVTVCQLVSQGSFYWWSGTVADPSLAGWWKNYTDWLFPYMRTAATYIGLAAALEATLNHIAGLRGAALVTR